jgi:hypothetical protein
LRTRRERSRRGNRPIEVPRAPYATEGLAGSGHVPDFRAFPDPHLPLKVSTSGPSGRPPVRQTAGSGDPRRTRGEQTWKLFFIKSGPSQRGLAERTKAIDGPDRRGRRQKPRRRRLRVVRSWKRFGRVLEKGNDRLLAASRGQTRETVLTGIGDGERSGWCQSLQRSVEPSAPVLSSRSPFHPDGSEASSITRFPKSWI